MADGTGALRIASTVLWDSGVNPADGSPSASRAGGDVHPAPLVRALARRRRWQELLRETRSLPTAVERELSPRATPSPFARPVGTRRAVAFAAVPLAEARTIKGSLGPGITVNDVVLAVTASGLRHWLNQHGKDLSGLRVKVPVSLHGHDEPTVSVGNRDSFFFVDLPLKELDPVRRLMDISRQSARRKRLGDAQALDLFFRDVAHVSERLGRTAARWSMSPRVFTLNVSNVSGPAGPLDVCGRRVRAVHSVVEVADWHAIRVSALSACGLLTFGICTDAEVAADVEVIAEGIRTGFADLLRHAV
jgi:WS/DGAT/MGAT family acyltransferase